MRSESPTDVAHPTIWPRGTASMARDAMRVLHRDPKTGEIKIRVENADDLWHLHNLVRDGDLVRASTYRREDVKTDKVRPERGEKVRVTLTIRVEGVEFQAFSDRLRITGVIVEGPQDLGRHHTLNVAVDDVLSIINSCGFHVLIIESTSSTATFSVWCRPRSCGPSTMTPVIRRRSENAWNSTPSTRIVSVTRTFSPRSGRTLSVLTSSRR